MLTTPAKRRRRQLVGAAVLCLLATAAGCSAPGRPAGKQAGPEDKTRADRIFGGSLPIRAYMLTAEQNRVVHRAMQRLIAPCMQAQGFTIGLPDRFEAGPGAHQPDFHDRRYDPVYDEETARRYGYHLPFAVDVPTVPPNDPRMTDAAMEALFGTEAEKHSREEVNVAEGRTSNGGCAGKAEKVLAEGMAYVTAGAHWAQPVRLLGTDSSWDNDPRIVAAQAEWSRCMAERGYRVTHTTADEDREPKFDLNTPTPSRAEVEAALWDVACQKRTGVVRTMFEVETAYELRRIDEQPAVFAQVKKENQLLVERAATLLGESAP